MQFIAIIQVYINTIKKIKWHLEGFEHSMHVNLTPIFWQRRNAQAGVGCSMVPMLCNLRNLCTRCIIMPIMHTLLPLHCSAYYATLELLCKLWTYPVLSCNDMHTGHNYIDYAHNVNYGVETCVDSRNQPGFLCINCIFRLIMQIIQGMFTVCLIMSELFAWFV